MNRLIVEFSTNRDFCGVLTLIDDKGRKVCGPWPVAGRATDALAAAHGNPGRNPLLRYGDTPTGSYRLRQIAKSGSGTPFATSEFGPHGVVLLEGVAGDAAIAEANGRFHLLITGGKLSHAKELRSTAGALRLANEHQKALIGGLRRSHEIRCDVIERARLPKMGRVFVDASYREEDPISVAAEPVLSQSRRSTGNMLRAGASGATSAVFFGFSVSFVALDAAPARASAEVVVADPSSLRKSAKFVLPEAAPTRGYTRMAYGAPAPGPSTEPDHPTPTPPSPGPTFERLKDMGQGGMTTGKGFDGGPSPTDATGSGAVGVPPTPNASPSPSPPAPQATPPSPSNPPTPPSSAWEKYQQEQKLQKPSEGDSAWQKYQQEQQNQKSGANDSAWQKYQQEQAKTPPAPKPKPRVEGAPEIVPAKPDATNGN